MSCETKFRDVEGGINAEVINRRQAEIENIIRMANTWPPIIQLDETVRFKAGVTDAKFGFNTAENEPAKNSQIVFANFVYPC